MKTIKEGYKGPEVTELRNCLGITGTDDFDDALKEKVINYQKENGLTPDGIVGWNSWKSLLLKGKTEIDYIALGKLLDCKPAAVYAITKVESGGSGFIEPGKPKILFEGHIFWQQLKKDYKEPASYLSGNSDILYPKWTKKYYKGGKLEYDRLERAMKIDKVCALKSISMGMFQILGLNYNLCGCKSVNDMWNQACESTMNQVIQFCEFIKSAGILPDLQRRNWKEVARKYNGPSYAINKYDKKLENA